METHNYSNNNSLILDEEIDDEYEPNESGINLISFNS